jgi:hypothetical protein
MQVFSFAALLAGVLHRAGRPFTAFAGRRKVGRGMGMT